MRSVSDVLHNKGGFTEFPASNGKTYKIKYLTLRAMSQYENKLQNRALKLLAESKPELKKEDFADLFTQLMENIAAGVYSFGGETCSKSLTTIQGITDLISILCEINSDEAMELLLNDGTNFKVVFDEVVRKSINSKDDDDGMPASDEKKS